VDGSPPTIRRLRDGDWPSVWPMLRDTFARADTYAFAPDIAEADARRAWLDVPAAAYVALDADRVVGTYYIKPNQQGPGSHVCNCGYVVARDAEGRGIATAMCEHSQREAIAMGFRAMQFNLVVATNERAIRLWKRLGFDVVGTLPGAFRHAKLGYVDALVMFKTLVASARRRPAG
jgi:ribosomal protein S18 acetylase RimI-like enzyme